MRLSTKSSLLTLSIVILMLVVAPAFAQLWGNTYQFYPSLGYYNGKPVYFLTTDVSDQGYALTLNVNYTPRLAYALSSGSGVMPNFYYVTNNKNNVVLSTEWTSQYASSSYMPLWILNTVTWNSGKTPTVLKSVADINAAIAAGSVTVKKLAVVVGASIIINSSGTAIKQAFVSRTTGTPLVRLPVRGVYINNLVYKILQLDFSNTYAVTVNKGTYAPLLARFYLPQPSVTQKIYSFWQWPAVGQLYVASEAPNPFGPNNTNALYSPLMNEWMVKTPNSGFVTVYTNAAAIQAVLTVSQTTYIAYQPVVGR